MGFMQRPSKWSRVIAPLILAIAGRADARARHFSEPTRVLSAFGADDGWRVGKHPRLVADVNGDGRDDLVGFDDHGVVVALSQATARDGPAFAEPRLWIDAFGDVAGDWRPDRHIRLLADVDGDGLHDVVGFGEDGVVVSLSLGDRFAAPERWTEEFASADGAWRLDRHLRLLADVDGDGALDIVGFADDGVRVARGSGRDFQPSTRWLAGFGDGEWMVGLHPRMLADVSGDGLPDIVGFHDAGVFVSLSTGSAFTPPGLWLDVLGTEDGFESQARFPRVLADVDGDAHADIVAFARQGVLLARSTGDGFAGPELVLTQFSPDGGWDPQAMPRLVADVDDDGRADIVGFAGHGVLVALSLGEGFVDPATWVWGYGLDQGWRVGRHPRLLGDVDDDGQRDILGVFDDGVWVSLARP